MFFCLTINGLIRKLFHNGLKSNQRRFRVIQVFELDDTHTIQCIGNKRRFRIIVSNGLILVNGEIQYFLRLIANGIPSFGEQVFALLK